MLSFINDIITPMDITMHIYPANKAHIHYKLYVSHIKGQPAPVSEASKTLHRDPPFNEPETGCPTNTIYNTIR